MHKRSSSFLAFFICLGILVGLSNCGSNSPDAVFHNGVLAYQDSDPIGASLYFEDFIKKFPDDERVLTAYQALARCYFDMKDFANMRAVFEEMKEKFPDPNTQITCDFQIGGSYFNEGFYDKAVVKFSEIADATTNPRIRVQALGNLAGVYAKQTQSATAQSYYDQMYKIGESEVEDATEALDIKLMALSGKANVLKASSEFNSARNIYKQTLDLVADATGITGIDNDREEAVLNWVNTWKEAGDYITSVTMYDRIQNHPYIQDKTKPWLIIHKIDDMQMLFREKHLEEKSAQNADNDEASQENPQPLGFTPQEIAVLVSENQRLIKDFPETDFAVNARVSIAQLVKESTPAEADDYFNEAIEMYEKYITNPPDPQRPLVALFQIADAYIRFDKLADAKQTLERIRQSYSQVPQAMQRVAGMLQFIDSLERERAKAEEEKNTARAEVSPAT
ncbi:MAG: tetratricopeptide repeat protein [Candidatus Omnitrophica bacterium]|nr:tetratricopeptide repeat protein [Candidatus Omnitrophota bacterium]